MAMRYKATDEVARADLEALPGRLDVIDSWIAQRVLGEVRPNVADLQIGSTIRLLLSVADVRPLIEGRPAATLADYFPPMQANVEEGVLPAAWLRAPAVP